jgi:hypothetical protein
MLLKRYERDFSNLTLVRKSLAQKVDHIDALLLEECCKVELRQHRSEVRQMVSREADARHWLDTIKMLTAPAKADNLLIREMMLRQHVGHEWNVVHQNGMNLVLELTQQSYQIFALVLSSITPIIVE